MIKGFCCFLMKYGKSWRDHAGQIFGLSDSKSKDDLLSSKMRRQHFFNFGIKVFFSFIMMTFDIGSDIATGIDFMSSSDYGWATFTFIIICTPWLARLVISLLNLRMCYYEKKFSQGRFLVWKGEMMDSLLEFPLLQPFRYIKLYLAQIFFPLTITVTLAN